MIDPRASFLSLLTLSPAISAAWLWRLPLVLCLVACGPVQEERAVAASEQVVPPPLDPAYREKRDRTVDPCASWFPRDAERALVFMDTSGMMTTFEAAAAKRIKEGGAWPLWTQLIPLETVAPFNLFLEMTVKIYADRDLLPPRLLIDYVEVNALGKHATCQLIDHIAQCLYARDFATMEVAAVFRFDPHQRSLERNLGVVFRHRDGPYTNRFQRVEFGSDVDDEMWGIEFAEIPIDRKIVCTSSATDSCGD